VGRRPVIVDELCYFSFLFHGLSESSIHTAIVLLICNQNVCSLVVLVLMLKVMQRLRDVENELVQRSGNEGRKNHLV